MIRITDQMQLNTSMANERRTSVQMSNLSAEASSGERVTNPSDDPTAYAQVVSSNARLARMEARSSMLTTANGDLTSADGALSSAGDLLAQAKNLALEAANGTQTATERTNTVTELASIKQQLVALGNTKGTNGYIFGGTVNGSPPFSATGAFTGNAQATTVEIADGVTTRSNASGADAFTVAGGTDVFAAIDALSTALTTNNTAGITTGIAAMDSANSQVISAQVGVGVLSERIQSSITMLSTSTTNAKVDIANLKDADVAQVYSQLSTTQTAYQAAIQVNSEILSTLESRFS